MSSDRLVLSVLIALLLLPRIAAADFEECAEAATQSIGRCNGASHGAKAQADALAASHSAAVAKDSLRDAAEREAGVTKNIMAIYAAAKAICASAKANAKAACTGEDADVADAVAEDIAGYESQLDPGTIQNSQGHRGSTLSQGMSTGRAAGDLGGYVPGTEQVINSSHTSATSGGGNNPEGYDNPDILQRPVGAEDRSSGKRSGNNGGGSDEDEDEDSAVGESTVAGSGANSGSSPRGGTAGDSDYDAPTAREQAGKTRSTGNNAGLASGGSTNLGALSPNLHAALLARCQRDKNFANEECRQVVTQNFCADSGNAMCPTCQGMSVQSVAAAEGAGLNNICVSACTKDPMFGPQLGGVCRAMFAGRQPASPDTGGEIAGARGPSLFFIHSQAVGKWGQRKNVPTLAHHNQGD